VWNSPAYHTDFTVITANVQAAAQDTPVRAVSIRDDIPATLP